MIGAGNRLLADGTYNYTYDPAGNMLSQTNAATGAVMLFAYDADNRLSTVVMQNSSGQTTATVNLTYDLYGNLIGRAATTYVYSGGTTYSTTTTGHFVYDSVTGDMVLAFDGYGDLTNRFLYGPAVDEILAQEPVASNPLNASTNWMVSDFQGSVVDELMQESTAYGVTPIDHIAYNPWGQITSGTLGSNFGFTGVYTDPSTGMQYHNDGDDGRWYLPWAERWNQPDPTGLGPDSNPYRVCGNDPVNQTDPSGLAGEKEIVNGVADGTGGDWYAVLGAAIGYIAGGGDATAGGFASAAGERVLAPVKEFNDAMDAPIYTPIPRGTNLPSGLFPPCEHSYKRFLRGDPTYTTSAREIDRDLQYNAAALAPIFSPAMAPAEELISRAGSGAVERAEGTAAAAFERSSVAATDGAAESTTAGAGSAAGSGEAASGTAGGGIADNPKVLNGGLFNRVRAPKYPYNEVRVADGAGGYYVLDSYNPATGEIVSRKMTQLSEITENSAKAYLREAATKYKPGSTIQDVPTNKGIGGQQLQGGVILEVPIQDAPVPQAVIDAAANLGVTIRDVNGKIY